MPFEDLRPARKYSTEGRMFLLYLPLVPYVNLEFERLEESVRIQSESIRAETQDLGRPFSVSGATQYVAPAFERYYYPNSFPKAIAADLKHAGVFKNVAFVDQKTGQDYRYLLTGKIKATPLTRSVSSYGLGGAGVLLWTLPLPMTKTSAGITVDMTLTDTKTNKVVWQHEINSDISSLDNMYSATYAMLYGTSIHSFKLANPASDSKVDKASLFSWHFEALRLAMLEAKPLLKKSLIDYTSKGI